MTEVKNRLYDMIVKQISCDLTVGLEDNDKEKWSKSQISDYIKLHQNHINDLIEHIIKEDDDIDEWAMCKKPEFSIIREYMYDDEGPFKEYASMFEKLIE